ncbi:MAG: sporulation protein YqfD [Clostridia bacterium]|nr:sporulation protein YqfD [Clostridia bacterium]
MSLSLFLLGSRTLRVRAADRMTVLNLCLQNGFSYSGFCWETDGSVHFSVTLATARRLKRACRACGVELETVSVTGIPALLWGMRRRVGLVLGTLAAIALIWLSGRFVWDVEVTGNETLLESEVEALLRACDFGVGSYIPSVSVRTLENRVLLSTDRLAWISVYLDGTVAKVQVIEHSEEEKPPREDTLAPANLIAACDGQIETLQIYRGETVVAVGQAVKKGELLVSGIYDSQNAGFRYTRAAGEVFARTEHEYCIEIPLSYTEKVYGERKTQEIVLNFFDFSLKIFKNTGNDGKTCDIIKDNMGWNVPGDRPLPLFFTVTYAKPYAEQVRTRSAEEAVELAYTELEKTLEELSARAELLRKQSAVEITDTAVRLHCTVACIENIAVQAELEIQEAE